MHLFSLWSKIVGDVSDLIQHDNNVAPITVFRLFVNSNLIRVKEVLVWSGCILRLKI